MLAVHTEALAGRDETCSWMSSAVGASGDRVLTSISEYYNEICRMLGLNPPV